MIADRNKILIVNLGGIGDLLLSLPALKALRGLYPQAEIDLLVAPQAEELARDFSCVNNIFVININILLSLRKKRFDLAVNMRTLASRSGSLKIKLLLDIIKPFKKAGRDTGGRGGFFDIKIAETDIGQKYEMEYDLETVEALGAEHIDREIGLKVEKDAERSVSQLLENEGISAKDILIGIHPGGMPSRRWPVSNFARVIEEIARKEPVKFVITGAESESGLAAQLSQAAADIKSVNLCGKLNLKQLLALIKRCDLFISNDTGPMHIAAALKTPQVAIFGPGDIIRFDPRNISQKAVVVYKKPLDCLLPCNKVKCSSIACLKAVSVEDVVVAVLELLQKNKGL
jgi:heptosyltransferase II